MRLAAAIVGITVLVLVGMRLQNSVSFETPDVGGFNQYSKMETSEDLPGALQEDLPDAVSDQFLAQLDRNTRKCPDYVAYSQESHQPFLVGKHKYPYMRPAPKCRTFVLSAVERVIEDLKRKVRDPDLARLIENCLPNTLDTTILYHRPDPEDKLKVGPESFIVTGDIHAEWLRDAARQVSVYQPFVRHDRGLQEMLRGAINTQAYYVINLPYCNAFHPPRGLGVKKGKTAMDRVYPQPDWEHVFECKYEVDLLALFLTLSNEYFASLGGDSLFVTEVWLRAFEKVLIVLRRELRPLFDQESGQALPYYYLFQRDTNIGSETLPLGGVGNPVNFGTGLIRSAFRPLDDSTILQFFVPGNLHMLTELRNLRKGILVDGANYVLNVAPLISATDDLIENISRGIENHAIVDHPKWGKVYAYEVDGYGGAVFMDDANIPSLLSLPDMGYLDASDPIYQNTRKMILSKNGNPYYLTGKAFEGVGGPHIGVHNAWPMSLLVRIRTTDDDDEIRRSLNYIMDTTAGLGLMHESVQVNSRGGRDFTRSWFAWCNSEFGKTILDLAQRKPHLIFKPEYARPYSIDALFASERLEETAV